jgi:metallo-beta-lactamase class B
MNSRKLISFAVLLLVSFSALRNSTQSSARQQLPGDESNQPFTPFRIIGQIYYVGTNDLACYLITTSAGHILIDTGLEESAPIIRGNIATLGFKLQDIKIILSGHAHFDHVGGHADMKKVTGARVFASRGDAVLLESGGARAFHPLKPFKPVKVDRIIPDGGIVRLGGVALTAHLTPGHTEGNTTWTTVVEEKGKRYDVVFAGSMSINPGVHLVSYAPWPDIAKVYAKSFRVLKGLHCDVFLGPHASFFDMETKFRELQSNPASNPFVDPGGYEHYIAEMEKRYNEQLQHERKPSSQR